MRILCINCQPDFTWLTSKGLKLDVDFKNILLPKLNIIEVLCNSGNLFIPDIKQVASTYLGYDVIMVGWNPKDYDVRVTRSGGYAYPEKQPNGARLISVRVDDIPVNMYPLHELMHTICNIINLDFKDYKPKDFMDMTPIGNPPIWKNYYINDPLSTDPNSNFNQTWRNIIPFLDKLNNLNSMKIVTITRIKSTPKETIGHLRSFDAKFGCDTLELPWIDNKRNISCIPTGNYICKWNRTLKFPLGGYELQNVKNRSGIRIHPGNYFFNVQGCILLGSLPEDINHDGELDIKNSRSIINAFEKYLDKKDFILIIK